MNNYQTEIRKFQKKALHDTQVIHCLLGVGSESGEILDAVKKPWFSPRTDVPHEIDVDHLAEEIGDLLFYMTWLADLFNIDMDDVMQTNINKLATRYAKQQE